MFARVCIHKATLRTKIDFETNSFARLFTAILLGTFWRLPTLFKVGFSIIHTGGYFTSHMILEMGWGEGGSKERLKVTKLK